MTENEVAAIIGYWRCGMTFQEIGILFGKSGLDIELIIIKRIKNYDEYKK